ncbi:ATP-binding protein [Sphingomonas sp.]|uniref:ATP-binding protein n=1 Tax=Sphingomonas sp. TaxID=28214 RepID=UPI00286D8BD2|nr:ATP-binding protein [Sphingomonas sp.]
MRALTVRPSVPVTAAAIVAALLLASFLLTSGTVRIALLAVTCALVLPAALLTRERARIGASNRMLLMAEELADFGHWRLVAGAAAVECSGQARAIAGIAARAVSRADALALIHPADRRPLLRCLAKARAGTPVECRARLRRRDGKLRTIALKVRRDGGGNAGRPGLFGIVSDISDTIAAERKLITTRDAARAAAKAKSQFLATMSHEIRTPMTGVLGMIELLRGNPAPADRVQYLDAMRQSSDLLMAILDDVLDFAKIESGKLSLDHHDFDFAALARSTIDMYSSAAARKGLHLSLALDCPASPVVRGDSVRLQQVLCNLISNAVKFTAAGHVTVTVAGRPGDGPLQCWRVAVEDSGIGIRAAEQKRLFQPFTQADNARGHGGTGLGLSISRWLVEAMGGTLRLVSRPARGSTFSFELALAAGTPWAEAAAASPAGDGQPDSPLRALRVLVAEDNAISQLVVGAMLKRLGHQATCVANGRLAVEAALAEPFDCILMDMQMPEMDGLAATRAVRASAGPCADAPIIALTADASAERRRFYDNAGLTGFMTKPINSEELRARLSAIAQQPARFAVPPDDAMPPAASPLDPRRLEELRGVLGPRRVEALLKLLERELVDRTATIRRLAAKPDLTPLRHEAHSLKGAALSMGATAVGAAAAALERPLAAVHLARALAELERHAGLALTSLAVAIPPRAERRRNSA